MSVWRKEQTFAGWLVMVGFGCVGQGVLLLLLRHIDMPVKRWTLMTRGSSRTSA